MASKPNSQRSSSARNGEDSKNVPKSPPSKRRSARQNQAARRAAQRASRDGNGLEAFSQAPKVEYRVQSKSSFKPIVNRFVHDSREQNQSKQVSPQPNLTDRLQKESTPHDGYSDRSGSTVVTEHQFIGHTKGIEPETIQGNSVASQTLEQYPTYGGTVQNSLNLPEEAYNHRQENKQLNNNNGEYEPKYVKSLMFGGIRCAFNNRSERPTSNITGNHRILNDAATTTADFADTAFRLESNHTNNNSGNTNMNSASIENAPIISSAIYENIAMRSPGVDNIDSSINPDDTYARVCSLGQPMTYASALSCGLVKAENSQSKTKHGKLKSKKSSSEEESMQYTVNTNTVEGEGWNPLFYEPLLVPCPYSVPIPYPSKEQWKEMVIAQREKHLTDNAGENTPSSSSQLSKNHQQTLYQQIQNWLAQGQANYLQKQKAFQATKLEDPKNAEAWKQQQQQAKMMGKRQNQQQPIQGQTTNMHQRLQKENVSVKKAKSLKKTGFRHMYAPYTVPTEVHGTWSSRSANAGNQKGPNYEMTKSMPQTSLNSIKNIGNRRNFGSFNGPLPTLTPSAFPNPYLWSVDSSNPLWLTDQRPNFENVNSGDTYGLNLLPTQPKKKESTEFVDAIKAGVGLLGPSAIETYYENLCTSRPNTFQFDDINKCAQENTNEPSNLVGTIIKDDGLSSISNINMSTQTFQQSASPIFSQEFTCANKNSVENGISKETSCFMGANNKAVNCYQIPLYGATFTNTELELQQKADINEKDNRFGWKTVPSRSKKNATLSGLLKKSNSSIVTSSLVLESHISKDTECATTSKKSTNIVPIIAKFGSTTNGTHGNKTRINETDSDEFLSGAADDDLDFGEDSLKSCLQCHCDYSEGWNESWSVSSLEEDKHEIVSGASSSNISTRFVTPSELELTYTNHEVTRTNEEDEEVSPNSTLEDSSKTLQPLDETADDLIQTEIDSNKKSKNEDAQNFTFDMDATRSKLQNFNLYIEPKDPSSMEPQGVECTVEAMKVLLNTRVNNRPCVRGILSIHQKVKPDELRQKNPNCGGGGIERQFYQCNSPNSEIQPRGHGGPMQISGIDDANVAKRSVPRYNSNWKPVEMMIARQQQNQQQSQQQQQGFNISQSQHTSIFTNSFRNNNHAKRDWRKPRQTKSATLHSPHQMQQQSKLDIESLKLAVPPGEPNTRPMHLENFISCKEKHVELIHETPKDSIEYNVQIKPSNP